MEERPITVFERCELCRLQAMDEAGVDNWDSEWQERYQELLKEKGLEIDS